MLQLVKNLTLGTIGSVLVATAVIVFLSPNHIVTGGPPGIAIVLFHLLGLSKGLTVLILNGVLMIIGAKLVGTSYMIRTCFAIGCTAAFMELLTYLFPYPAVTTAPLLNALYGGILIGAGIAIIFKGEAAGGGWSLLARVISAHYRIGVGQCILLLDIAVLIASAIVFRDIESALWAGIGVYVTGVVIDLVLTGRAASKLLHISTKHAEELTQQISERLRDSGAIHQCNTVRDVEGRDLVILVMETSQISQINKVIRDVDPDAHAVVMDAVAF